MPISTGTPREVQAKEIQRYLDILNEDQSFSTAAYTGNFRNVSYVLSVIRLYLGQDADSRLVRRRAD
jgi:hypothetical protein